MKKNAKDPAAREGKKPFFARLLEEQELGEVSGGNVAQTLKFPSDADDHWGPIFTKKYPSDRDETTDGY
ncbi:microviridin/marinostatin family tricyclic proteinase inhibitor [Vitiosangium sp. GDMCC 1.1324]|uniref:microviridin/marinostatin family tricyclic proteinase inhibitor n=1 Tax=Vitiosangium sp. (strain GDMCC 1.1324) TaxID=2138576 RepID=UPI000D343FDD|nr:microviridin/marinostatin family tricyclic proteinase inhibitor [Vitiosangium sp. GDMCC 1.1324]PTL80924.1 hypothetical protein DAT35_26705 [Vitiosangium sp. GDMCC 1.1324]